MNQSHMMMLASAFRDIARGCKKLAKIAETMITEDPHVERSVSLTPPISPSSHAPIRTVLCENLVKNAIDYLNGKQDRRPRWNDKQMYGQELMKALFQDKVRGDKYNNVWLRNLDKDLGKKSWSKICQDDYAKLYENFKEAMLESQRWVFELKTKPDSVREGAWNRRIAVLKCELPERKSLKAFLMNEHDRLGPLRGP